MSQNQKSDLDKWLEESCQTFYEGFMDLCATCLHALGRSLKDVQLIAKYKPADLVWVAVWMVSINLSYWLLSWPISDLIIGTISWKWLAGLLLRWHKFIVFVVSTVIIVRLFARDATKEQDRWREAFERLDIRLNKLTPTFIETRVLEGGGKVIRLFSNGLCADDLIRKQAALSQVIREKITSIEDQVSTGEIRIQIAGFEVPKSLTVVAAMQAAERPTKWDIVFGLSENGYVVRPMIELPHLLIAGATGSGKSTALKSILFQLMCCEWDRKFVIIDTKNMDFHSFSRLSGVMYISNRESARVALEDLVELMQVRQRQIVKAGGQSFDQAFGKPGSPEERMIIVIDEFTDLIKPPLYESGSEERSRQILASIEAIGRLGRASGMHLILSTQLPDRSILNGLTRANFPAKLCFALPNIADSLAILGNGQAAQLSHAPGRAIYQEGAKHFVIQSPTITYELDEGRFFRPDREKPLDNVKSLLPIRVVKDKENLFTNPDPEKKE